MKKVSFISGKDASVVNILGVTGLVLLVPFGAMQLSDEVRWTAEDFLVAGAVLVGAGSAYELYIRNIKENKKRFMFGGLLLLVSLLVWAELAVGVFGLPIAGN